MFSIETMARLVPDTRCMVTAARATSTHLRDAALERAEVRSFGGGVAAPEVTVVVANYNHGRYLPALLGALAQQQEVTLELVLVDDGSTDGSFDVMCDQVAKSGLTARVLRLPANRGRSVARNVAILQARAPLVAFTDADCTPHPRWLAEGVGSFVQGGTGAVQGVTLPHPDQAQPFFNHFIEIRRFDGTFSTCNMFYRTRALVEAGGFDPAADYWEDLDLGWRVQRLGWESAFAPDAVVYHQVLALRPRQWLDWPRHFAVMPQKVRRYPEYRDYLFLKHWVSPVHAAFDLAAVGLALGLAAHPAFLALVLPYVALFPHYHGLAGQWPPLKALLHLAWDVRSAGVLLTSSLRHGAVVM